VPEIKDIYPRAAALSDDPRVEFPFYAEKGETVSGYCARVAAARAKEIRSLKAKLVEQEKKIEAAREFACRIQAMMDAGQLVDRASIKLTCKPIKHSSLDRIIELLV